MRFTKMQGLGNDYVYVNCFQERVDSPVELARQVSDRHFGIGGDGLILIEPSKTADVKMRIFNADGSEAEMCGNGCRCVAKYSYEHGLVKGGESFSIPGQPPCPASLTVETGHGVLRVGLITDRYNEVTSVCVNMGQPILTAKDIPVAMAIEQVVNEPISIADREMLMTCVSMGNPHAVFFCDDVEAVELERIGPLIENHNLFPNRINAHFVQVQSPSEFTMRTWERGSGLTLACGTGACACQVAAAITGRCGRRATAHLPGGDLSLNWSQEDNCVYMTGPAVEVFEGIWPEK